MDRAEISQNPVPAVAAGVLKGSKLSQSVREELCQRNRDLEKELADFMAHVPTAREESLSEFLFWRWRLLDSRFNYQTVHPVSAVAEPGIGADFLLELWLANASHVMPLLIQAKKFTIERGDRYRHRLLYPHGTGDQVDTLLKCADAMSMLPRYLVYTGWRTGFPHPGAMYLIDAESIQAHARPTPPPAPRAPLRLSTIVSSGFAFHKLFCPGADVLLRRQEELAFVQSDGKNDEQTSRVRSRTDAPAYVQALLERANQGDQAERLERLLYPDLPALEKGKRVRIGAVGVYDLSAIPKPLTDRPEQT